MREKKLDFIIVSKNFWPNYNIIGEALFDYANSILNAGFSVGVITLSDKDLNAQIPSNKIGKKIKCFYRTTPAFKNHKMIYKLFTTVYFAVKVFFVLIFKQPKVVYVSTDPPILSPAVVSVYGFIFKSKIIYHVQDIHPEATNTNITLNRLIYNLAKSIDNFSLNRANLIITLNETMEHNLKSARNIDSKNIILVRNPIITNDSKEISTTKKLGFSFCGNMGRMQRIPLLTASIEKYIKNGGCLKFVFAGNGFYRKYVSELATKYPGQVKYIGQVPWQRAAKITASHEWAFLPIEDSITKFAFPSKADTSIALGAKLFTICSEETPVGGWVKNNNLGIVVDAKIESVVAALSDVEIGRVKKINLDVNALPLNDKATFVSTLVAATLKLFD